MQFKTIEYAVENDIAVISLNRPEVMNALNSQMRAEITAATKRAGDEARVLVITGNGSAFCSGQDLGDGRPSSRNDAERILRDEYEPMVRAISSCSIPTISAVNGPAAGAGANLALAADVVIASSNAYFLQAFSRIGLIPDAGGTYFMPRTMGLAKSIGATLFAEKITAEQADAWGLIWEAVSSVVFDDHWRKRAAYLAKGPTQAYVRAKEALRQSSEHDFDGQLALEAKLQGECGATRDFQEGVLAFLEKRAPQFEGR